MKMLPFICLAVSIISFGKSQDLIVTTTGDSIHCRITKVDNKYTYFTFKYKDEYRRTLIPSTEIRETRKNFFSDPIIPAGMLQEKGSKGVMRGRMYGGWGYRTAKISSDLSSDAREYLEELKRGYTFGGEMYYYFSETVGYGGMFSIFRTSNEISSISLADDISISYFGPAVQSRMRSGNGNIYLLSTVGLGYLKYYDKAKAGSNITFDAGTLGLMFGFGMDFKINDNFGGTIGVSYLQGQITEVTVSANGKRETIKLDKKNYESLNRLDLNIGIYFPDSFK